MSVYEIVVTILNLFLAGGLVTLVTIKHKAKSAEEEAEKLSLDNEEKRFQIINENIVQPLRKETNALQKEVRLLRNAIKAITRCPHGRNCPVDAELRKPESSEN